MKTLKQLMLVFLLLFGNITYAEDNKITDIPSGLIKWKKFPTLSFDNNMLGTTKDIIKIDLLITANETGEITSVNIIKSNATQRFNNYLIERIKKGSLEPYQENGVYYPFKVVQPFEFEPAPTIWDKAFWENLFK